MWPLATRSVTTFNCTPPECECTRRGPGRACHLLDTVVILDDDRIAIVIWIFESHILVEQPYKAAIFRREPDASKRRQ